MVSRSIVVDHVLSYSSERTSVAYFYCQRDNADPDRADPGKNLHGIARQLSGIKGKSSLRTPIVELYKSIPKEGHPPRELSILETVGLILDLTSEGSTSIVIDALDECNPSNRQLLLESLDELLYESSGIIKIFVSSRDDGDVCCRLEQSPNLYISSTLNGADIDRYVDDGVSRAIEGKRLAGGRVSDRLKSAIIDALKCGAHQS